MPLPRTSWLCPTALFFAFAMFAVFRTASGADAFPLMSARVQSWVDRGYYSGCSVWIARGDTVLYERSFGNHSADTEVFIASAGKWLASAAILAVVDEGRLSLDDPAGKWLPEFRRDPKGRATLRQMLAHTTGFPPYQPADKPRDGYQTTAGSVAHLLPLAPHYAPGERFDYGGLAMQVAGRMAEVATGKNWEDIFQEKIARPLGMTRTRFTPVDPDHTPMIGGGAVSTRHDYARFLTMIADGGVFAGRRILSSTALHEMQADQIGAAHVKREEFVERVRGNTHRSIYGLGLWREELDAHSDATVISSPGWAGTYPWIDRRHDIRGVIIAHVDTGVVARAGFSGFWTSPVLMKMVRAELGWKPPRGLPAFQEGIVRAMNADLAYEVAGPVDGVPVVLVHGHSFDRRMWDPQFAELAKRYRVIRYDLRGYGLSDLPAEGRDFRHADDLRAVLDHFDISKAHVVGLSLGGYVVGDFLALHPGRVLSATIASGAVHEGDGSRRLAGDALAKRLEEIERTRAEGIAAYKMRWREALLRSTGPRADGLRPLLTDMIETWSAWQPLHVEPPLLLGPAVIERLAAAKPTAPVLWIAGKNDRFEAQAAKFAAVLPQMRVVVLPDAGHLSNLEQPEAFTEALTRFLDNSPSPAQSARPITQ